MEAVPYLIVCPDADAYLSLVDDPDQASVARNAAEARRAWDGQPVLLGEPAPIAQVLPDLPGVRWVQSTWAGVTPLLQLGRCDFLLTNVRGIFGPQMSEYVFAHLLARELRLPERARAQADRRWWNRPSGTLAGKRMGIMGTGSIGQAVAAAAITFGMTVTGLSRSGVSKEPFSRVVAVSAMDEFLEDLDVLVAVLPDTAETDRLLGAGAFARLPNHAVFINIGRGNLVDESALAHALKSGKLAGAVLDVFEQEPLPAASPLWGAPNLSLTAHIAAQSHPELIAPIFNRNYRRFRNGEPLDFQVDFEKGY